MHTEFLRQGWFPFILGHPDLPISWKRSVQLAWPLHIRAMNAVPPGDGKAGAGKAHKPGPRERQAERQAEEAEATVRKVAEALQVQHATLHGPSKKAPHTVLRPSGSKSLGPRGKSVPGGEV